jgi:hypothetical protein
MESMPQVPSDILRIIFSLSDQEVGKLAMVSKDWNRQIKDYLISLFAGYEQNEALKPYAELAKQMRPATPQAPEGSESLAIHRVKFVFQTVMKRAQQVGFEKETPTVENVSPAHLQEIASKVQTEEAKNLTLFASRVPQMATFLATVKDDSLLEKAKEIQKWMQAHAADLKTIIELDLTELGLTALPQELFEYFTSLQELSLANNQLTILPGEIGQLTALEQLALGGNQLVSLPSEITSLTRLEELYLANNKLKAIPSELHHLPALKILTLGDNPLPTFPLKIGRLIYEEEGSYLS